MQDIQSGRDLVTLAKQKIAAAEADLGTLTKGQCRDLLKDNFCISHEEACLVVAFIKGEDDE